MDLNSRTAGASRIPHRTVVALWLGVVVSLAGWISSPAEAEFRGTASSAKPAVKLRAKSPMSRQPRPLSAPIKHLGERADTAVTLLGIEGVNGPEDEVTTTIPTGEWTLPR